MKNSIYRDSNAKEIDAFIEENNIIHFRYIFKAIPHKERLSALHGVAFKVGL